MAKYMQADNFHVGVCYSCDAVHLVLLKNGEEIAEAVLYDESVQLLIGQLETLLETKPRPCPAPKVGSGVTKQ
jgi:hypothetical protein